MRVLHIRLLNTQTYSSKHCVECHVKEFDSARVSKDNTLSSLQKTGFIAFFKNTKGFTRFN